LLAILDKKCREFYNTFNDDTHLLLYCGNPENSGPSARGRAILRLPHGRRQHPGLKGDCV